MLKVNFLILTIFSSLFVLGCSDSLTNDEGTNPSLWRSTRNAIIQYNLDTLSINCKADTWANWYSSNWNGPMLSSWEDPNWEKDKIGAFLELGISHSYITSPEEKDSIKINLSDSTDVPDIHIWVQLYKWSDIENDYISGATYSSHRDQLNTDSWINSTLGEIIIFSYRPSEDNNKNRTELLLKNVKLELNKIDKTTEGETWPNSIKIINAYFSGKPKN